MGRSVRVRLEVYLPFRGRRIWKGEEQVPAGTTTGQLLERLALGEPELSLLVNGRNLGESHPLREGDEVAILRHADGG